MLRGEILAGITRPKTAENKMTGSPRPTATSSRDTLLKATGIFKHFGDFTANDDVSFSISRGEIHALLGENGAGKSTFVKMIYGLLQPDSGQFEWQGVPVVIRLSLIHI